MNLHDNAIPAMTEIKVLSPKASLASSSADERPSSSETEEGAADALRCRLIDFANVHSTLSDSDHLRPRPNTASYLKGISTGDFSEALASLVGQDADGLSASTITRLTSTWWDEYEARRKRDLTGKRNVYIWADGVYLSPRLDDDRQCMLVIIGADECGDKDVLGIMGGFRENADSWRDLLRSLEKRALTIAPDLACGDGALGLWTALRDV